MRTNTYTANTCARTYTHKLASLANTSPAVWGAGCHGDGKAPVGEDNGPQVGVYLQRELPPPRWTGNGTPLAPRRLTSGVSAKTVQGQRRGKVQEEGEGREDEGDLKGI